MSLERGQSYGIGASEKLWRIWVKSTYIKSQQTKTKSEPHAYSLGCTLDPQWGHFCLLPEFQPAPQCEVGRPPIRGHLYSWSYIQRVIRPLLHHSHQNRTPDPGRKCFNFVNHLSKHFEFAVFIFKIIHVKMTAKIKLFCAGLNV